MRYILIFFILLFRLSAYSQSSGLVGKAWSYKMVVIIYKQDTVTLFHSDSVKNIYHLGKVSFTFRNNNTYEGTDINGLARSGTWSLPDTQAIIVDSDTNQIQSLTGNNLRLSSAMRYQGDSIDIAGTLLTVFYTTPPVTSMCETVQSGDWTNSIIWSCGHEPTIVDVAVINPGHVITVSTNTAQVQRIIYYGGLIKFSSSGSKIFIKGSD